MAEKKNEVRSVSKEMILRARRWLDEVGLRSAEVNLVAVLAEFASAQIQELEMEFCLKHDMNSIWFEVDECNDCNWRAR